MTFIAFLYLLGMNTLFTALSVRAYNREPNPINLTVAFMTLTMILATLVVAK